MTLHHSQNLRPGWRPRTATEVLSELDATHARLGLVDGVCEGCGLTAVLEDRRRRGRGVPPGPMDAAQALSWLGLPPVVSEAAAEAGKDAAGLPLPAFTFWVNTVAFGTEERFGTTTDLVEDLERLGVTVARHPGGAQLFLEHLLRVSDDPALASVAPRGRLLPITPEEMDEDVLYTLVNGSTGMRVLSQVVQALATRGSDLKLYITLFDQIGRAHV